MFPFSKSNHGSPQPSEFCMKIRFVWYSEFFIKHILCRIILRLENLFVHVVHAEYGQGCSDPPSEIWINFLTYKTDWSQNGTVETTEPPGEDSVWFRFVKYLPTISYLWVCLNFGNFFLCFFHLSGGVFLWIWGSCVSAFRSGGVYHTRSGHTPDTPRPRIPRHPPGHT